MDRMCSVVLAMASGLAFGGAASVAAAATPQDEVLQVEHGIAAATNADQLAPYYAADVSLYDMLVPSEFHGWQAVRDNFAAQFAQVRNPRVEIIDLTVVAGDTLAYAYSTQRFSFVLPDSGQHAQVVFRQTDGLKKIEGRWLVTHQHLSVPYDPATGKAVLVPPGK